MITIWFEPHGTTPDREAKRASGWNDVELSEVGIRDAEAMAVRCTQRGIDLAFSSDLIRAHQTALIAMGKDRRKVFADWRLRECDYGDFTLRQSKVIEAERAKRISEPFPNGESYEQCMERMSSFLPDLKRRYDGQTILIVGHHATHYMLDHFVDGKSLQECVDSTYGHEPGWMFELQ